MTDRRTFIKFIGAAGLGLLLPFPVLRAREVRAHDKWGDLLPLNTLGKTGQKVTVLGTGGFHVGRMTDYEAQKTIETAIAGGIRFFDAAESYVQGENERKYGRLLTPVYRNEIFLMTKTKARDAATAQAHLEGSLERMKTDYVDLWLVHQVDSETDFDNVLATGMFDVFRKAKESGKVKHIGFSGHRSPQASLYTLDKVTDDIEANMLPVNILDPSYNSFVTQVLPVLRERNVGVIAMKSLAGGAFWGGGFEGHKHDSDKVIDHISVSDAIHFALSMPIDVLVTGAKDAAMLQEKIDLVNSFAGMDDDQRAALIERVAYLAGTRVEYYKA